jgi:hypothetical protein
MGAIPAGALLMERQQQAGRMVAIGREGEGGKEEERERLTC